MADDIQKALVDTPAGKLYLEIKGEALVKAEFGTKRKSTSSNNQPIAKNLARKINSYFRGDINALKDIKVSASGTAFQRKVWNALKKIPAGKTTSYGELAAKIGSPKASRAVGAACGANPVSLIVPCHRVIGKSGALTGFASGISRKKQLLEHEGVEF